MKTIKAVKIVRATRGNEDAAAQALADFYNEMSEKNARTSRAIITQVDEDIVYTVYADIPVPDDADDEDVAANDAAENENDDDDMTFLD